MNNSTTDEAPSAKVVALKKGGGAIDIVARLRAVADEIESGKVDMPEVVMLMIEFNVNEVPIMQQFGVARPNAHLMGILECCKIRLLTDGT